MMRILQFIIIFILMVAIPTSSIAGISIISHCPSNSDMQHEPNTDSSSSDLEHKYHQHMNHSGHEDHNSDCGCDCSGEISCSISGQLLFVILNTPGDGIIKDNQVRNFRQSDNLPSGLKSQLYKPPISLS